MDARSNTFLTGYPPTEVLCCGEQIAAHAKLTVNSVEITLDAFLRRLQKAEKLSSYVIEFFGYRTELTISPVNLRSKAELLLGFALDNRKLAPIVTPLNENQPALRGTILIDEPVISENALVSLSSSDLLALTSKGQRKMISDEAISILEEAINQSKQKQQLVQIVLRDLSRTKSVPIHALQAPAIRALLKESVRR